MVYHPHVHFVVPGGVKVNDQGHALRWQATPKNFLFHHDTLVNVYKAKLADHLRACGLYDQVPSDTWKKKFVVNIEPVGDGRAVLKYLAPYVHRVAISDSRIVACDESSVKFQYKPSGATTYQERTVPGSEFVRGTARRAFGRIAHVCPPNCLSDLRSSYQPGIILEISDRPTGNRPDQPNDPRSDRL